jgi:pimeloyl-ACP methyl ester carboxylesterase
MKKILMTLASTMRTEVIWGVNSWCFAAVAIAFFAAGVALSHRVEPGVRVETVTLAGDTPALQFLPADPGPHPVALLAHGLTASKEQLFRFGEALAAAGFTCVSVDFPGHGASARRLSGAGNARTLEGVARALGSVDVFVGHSMGVYAGAEAVRDAGLSPRLFIAVGGLPDFGKHGPPLLLLAGRFDEGFPPALLKARRDARLVLSPWSHHALEPWDPRLVDAAVEAACAAVGKTPPTAPTCWRWRLAGLVLGMLGAFGLGKLALRLPDLAPRWAWMRGPLFPVIIIGAFALTTSTWAGAAPHLWRAHQQIAAVAISLLVVMGAGRLGIPRWSFLALAAAVWIGCLIGGANILAFSVSPFMGFLFVGTVLGGIAAHRGPRRDGDIAMAIVVGYAIGQFIPRIF